MDYICSSYIAACTYMAKLQLQILHVYRLQAQTLGVGDYYNVINCVHLHIKLS